MGRKPCCNKDEVRKGAWTVQEDRLLRDYISTHGEGKWRSLPLNAGLNRCGKSCRLRWFNYLNPDIKRGNITIEEEDMIIELHTKYGNRWSLIAEKLPGRTDNEIKNYWNTSLKRKILKNGSKLEISSKSKKSTSKNRPNTSACTEILTSDPTSSRETSSPSNFWEVLLEDLELDSENQILNHLPHVNATNGDEMCSADTSTSVMSKDSFDWNNMDEIWKKEAGNESDWYKWLESDDMGSFPSFLEDDNWGNVSS